MPLFIAVPFAVSVKFEFGAYTPGLSACALWCLSWIAEPVNVEAILSLFSFRFSLTWSSTSFCWSSFLLFSWPLLLSFCWSSFSCPSSWIIWTVNEGNDAERFPTLNSQPEYVPFAKARPSLNSPCPPSTTKPLEKFLLTSGLVQLNSKLCVPFCRSPPCTLTPSTAPLSPVLMATSLWSPNVCTRLAPLWSSWFDLSSFFSA